jgi:hypothetical protein
LNAGGSNYPVSATFNLMVTGGGGQGGIVNVTTTAGGVVNSVNSTIAAGSGYSNTAGAATSYGNLLPTGMSQSILLGRNATGTNSSQFVIGDYSYQVTDTYFGGVYSSTAGSVTNHTLHGMGAAGSNNVGGNLTIAGGQGTGTGVGGSILFQTAPAGSSGSSANALVTVAKIDPNGAFDSSVAQTTVTPTGGSAAGTIVCSMPFAGSSYKKVIIYFNGYTYGTNAQVYTFPTAFTNMPFVSASNVTVTATASTTTYTITVAVAQTGWVILEGF